MLATSMSEAAFANSGLRFPIQDMFVIAQGFLCLCDSGSGIHRALDYTHGSRASRGLQSNLKKLQTEQSHPPGRANQTSHLAPLSKFAIVGF
jgi:hypothetical protein